MNLFQTLAGCDANLQTIVSFLKHGVFPIIQIGIPILLIIMGSIELGKAVISSDEKVIKAATSSLVKKCVAAVAVFFIVTIVSLVFGLFGSQGNDETGVDTNLWWDCWRNV